MAKKTLERYMCGVSTPHPRSLDRVMCLLLCAAGIYLSFSLSVTFRRLPSDFVQDYAAANALLRGVSIYGSAVAAVGKELTGFGGHLNFHPPSGVLWYLPWAALSYPNAFWGWNLFNLFSFWYAVRALGRTLDIPVAARSWTMPLVLFSFPWIFCMGAGQSSPLIAALLILGCCALQRGADVASGCFVALATSFKLYPGFLAILFITHRRWRALGAYLATLLAWCFVTLCVVPFADLAQYGKSVLAQNVAEWAPFILNQSIDGVSRALFSITPQSVPVLESPLLRRGFTLVLSIVVLSLTVLCAHQARSERAVDQIPRLWASFLCAMILLSPISWMHGFVVLVVPLTMLAPGGAYRMDNAALLLLYLILLNFPDVLIARALVAAYQPEKLPWLLGLGVHLPSLAVGALWFRSLRALQRPSKKCSPEERCAPLFPT